ncbi:DUF4166 domain-containing protein [Lysobacter changpingensis]|uniref:DUF4166 domain-containing protein n=1 Tax=Lysobacter changpingensis TaxID=2792784 RepID=UPI001A8FD981|nr:DUF4166 domain-containing protein [Lysobacter changpingensis]
MNATTPTPLYRQLLPARFDDLPPTVRALHERVGRHRYRGKVEVERGHGLLSRMCAWATRLPGEGRGTIEVEIDSAAQGERWARIFAGRAMRSRLWARDALLCERLGLVTFAFRLDVEPLGAGHAVVWRVAKVRALGVPLPRRWFDAVGAREYERDRRYRFDVFAALPWIGRLVHYRGWLDVDPT